MTTDFAKAPVGTPALEVCAACGQETGVVMIKTRGPGKGEYTGSRHVACEDSRCEFCQFLGYWMASEGHEVERDGKVAAAKIVERLEDGTEKLVAYVAILERDPRDAQLVDGTKFEWHHGMVVLAEREEGTQMKLVEILKDGV